MTAFGLGFNWSHPAIQASIAGCQFENPPVAAAGRNRPEADFFWLLKQATEGANSCAKRRPTATTAPAQPAVC